MTEQEIFLAALALPQDKRDEYLHEVCAENPQQKFAIQELLDLHDDDAEFMSVSAVVGTLDDPTTLRTGARVGPYELKETLGDGGMGVVFRATQKEPIGREVAIKIIKAGLDTKEVVSRFQTEQRALALMDHPFIAKVLEAGQTTGGRPFFVMELVDGLPITEFCDTNQLTMEQRLQLFGDVCKAIQHAHSKSVIHRDIKPGNILVQTVDGTPKPKVIDFGIAKALDQKSPNHDLLTKINQVVGTPLYMSPEQADSEQGGSIDTRTDIYSLGVLLYELLTGVTPFDRERLLKVADREVRRIICEEEPPKPSTKISSLGPSATSVSTSRATEPKKLQRTLRGDLDWIVMKSLEKDRERRYETAIALADDVQRFLNFEPVLASPPSQWYQFKRWVHRNQTLFAVASTMLVLLVGGVIGTSYGLMQAIKANEELETSLQQEAKLREQSQKNANLALRKSEQEKTQAEVATAIVQFLNDDLLKPASPSLQKISGKDVLVREALDQAAKKIETAAKPGGKFADKPLVEAAIRKTIGSTYTGLGLRVQAIPHLERGFDLLRDRDDLTDYFANVRREVLFHLTTEYSKIGRLQEAEQLGTLLVSSESARHGKDHYQVALAKSALAQVYYNQGRIRKSIELFENSIRIQEATKGPEDFILLTTQANLAFAYFRSEGHDDQALELTNKMLPVAEKRNSKLIHADILESLGMYKARSGNFDSAREDFLKARSLRTKVYGPKNEFTNSLNIALGTLASMEGDFEEAYKFQKLAYDISTDNKVPSESATQCILRGNIAWCLINLNRFEEAGEILKQDLEKTNAALGHNHHLIVRNYEMLNTIAEELANTNIQKTISLRSHLVSHYEILADSDLATAKDRLNLAIILGNSKNTGLFDRERAIEYAQAAKSQLKNQSQSEEDLLDQINKAIERLEKTPDQ